MATWCHTGRKVDSIGLKTTALFSTNSKKAAGPGFGPARSIVPLTALPAAIEKAARPAKTSEKKCLVGHLTA